MVANPPVRVNDVWPQPTFPRRIPDADMWPHPASPARRYRRQTPDLIESSVATAVRSSFDYNIAFPRQKFLLAAILRMLLASRRHVEAASPSSLAIERLVLEYRFSMRPILILPSVILLSS